jgi:hypothetical protein
MKLTIALVAAVALGGYAATSGYANAASYIKLVKGPDGVVYQLTPEQLKSIAAGDPDKCKPKCLIFLAFGSEWQVPVGSLNAYVIPAGTAEQLIKAGNIPVEGQWEPPPSP